MSDLLPLAVAQERLISRVAPLPTVRLQVRDAMGGYLSQTLHALCDHPPFDRSVMDGFAVGVPDTAEGWDIVGEAAAGSNFEGVLDPGKAVHISTGARVPDGTHAILPKEMVQASETRVTLVEPMPAPADRFVRRKGGDFGTGSSLMEAGDRFGPVQLALAMAGGNAHIDVARKPRVAILQTGSELLETELSGSGARVPATNGPMIAAMLTLEWTEVTVLPVAKDSLEALADSLAMAENYDVLVTIGGASVGRHDLVRTALIQWGAELDFWRVAMKPGKPLIVARRGTQHILGLPGNPVSSFVTARLFLAPLVRAMAGSRQVHDQRISLTIAKPLPVGGPRHEFLRARMSDGALHPLPSADSGALMGLSQATHLIERPIDCPPSRAGELVPAIML